MWHILWQSSWITCAGEAYEGERAVHGADWQIHRWNLWGRIIGNGARNRWEVHGGWPHATTIHGGCAMELAVRSTSALVHRRQPRWEWSKKRGVSKGTYIISREKTQRILRQSGGWRRLEGRAIRFSRFPAVNVALLLIQSLLRQVSDNSWWIWFTWELALAMQHSSLLPNRQPLCSMYAWQCSISANPILITSQHRSSSASDSHHQCLCSRIQWVVGRSHFAKPSESTPSSLWLPERLSYILFRGCFWLWIRVN